MRESVSLSLAFLLLALIPEMCLAQCVNRTLSVSRVQGTIVDSSGAPIPNVEVELKKDGERVAATKTNEEGRFSIQAIPGTYNLIANRSGFAHGFAIIDVGEDLVRLVRPTHLWMILDIGILEDHCTFTTTSRRQFEKAIQTKEQRS